MSDLPVPDPNAEFPARALDIQHDTDPAGDHGVARRIPHLGHAIFFFAVCLVFLFSIDAGILLSVHAHTTAVAQQHSFALFIGLFAAYALTFLVTVPTLPLLWHRSFLDGIHWTWRQAKLRWWKLLLLGCALSVTAQALEHFVKTPVTSDITLLMTTRLHAWIVALLGSFIPPVVEEIAFRGFLLPALATAYDWLSLERTPAGFDRWQRTTSHTRGAWIFAALLSSAAFASIHGGQLHWASGPLIILFIMSLVFAAVRIVTRSVAASTLVHIAYDGLIFIELIVATGGFRHLDKLT